MGGETLNIFLLTGISNINIFFIKNKNIVVVNTNIYGKFATKIRNYNVKKNITQTNILKTYTIDFVFERVEDICPLPGDGQNSPLPLHLPPTHSD